MMLEYAGGLRGTSHFCLERRVEMRSHQGSTNDAPQSLDILYDTLPCAGKAKTIETVLLRERVFVGTLMSALLGRSEHFTK